MSWNIVLFNSKQKIESIAELDESLLEPIAFNTILETSFDRINSEDNHREIVGNDFTIEFYYYNEKQSNLMLSLYGENGLFALIELAKKYNWQIYDSCIDEMIDLKNPEKNGFDNHRKYVEKILRGK